MKRCPKLAALLLCAGTSVSMLAAESAPTLTEHSRSGQSPDAEATTNESLAAFGALVVGSFEANDSRHEYEWGIDGRVIRSRSYFKSDEGWTLVSEGMWFWDPGESIVRGAVVAIDMPVDLFEYRSVVEDDEIVHELMAHGAQGGRFIERWVFDDDGYRWTLERPSDESTERLMSGAYRRVGPRRIDG